MKTIIQKLTILVTIYFCRANVLYVKPTTSASESCLHSNESSFKTLEEYAKNSTVELDNKDNLTMILLRGVHTLTEESCTLWDQKTSRHLDRLW